MQQGGHIFSLQVSCGLGNLITPCPAQREGTTALSAHSTASSCSPGERQFSPWGKLHLKIFFFFLIKAISSELLSGGSHLGELRIRSAGKHGATTATILL